MSTSQDPVFDTRFRAALLHPRHWLTWLSLALLLGLAWFPVRLRDRLARSFSSLLIRFSKRQCDVARTNFEICFPELDEAAQESLLKQCIEIGLQTFFAFAEATSLPKSRFMRRFKLQGWEHVEQALATGKPIIFMIPHSWAIDLAGLYMTALGLPMCTMMHSAKNQVYDWFINRQRASFGGKVYERGVGIKPAIKSMRAGFHFFYLPDQDHGVKLADAIVVPMFSAYDPDAACYELIYRPPLTPYPTADLTADTRQMNAEIEALLDSRREQYMWFLKYFRSRPAGDPTRVYRRR
ncbi:MAG: lauroyl-Kdo(2)-lipid IV(A) myristoyltransferase [Aeromonadaceae bacterium]